MAATSALYDMPGDTINPQFTMQDNADLNSIFNGVEPAATLTNTSWGLDQFLDYGGCNELRNEFPFPQSQNNAPSFGIAPQVTTSFMPSNNMMGLQTRSNSQQAAAGGFYGQAAGPSTLTDTTNTGYNTRQAVGYSQKRERESTESNQASVESSEKKPRKQRKKRSKQLSKEEADEKRQKFLDRNKVAAHKCRQRKKEWTDNLQNRASAYQQHNEVLRHEVANAFAELDILKAWIKRMQPLQSGPGHTCDAATGSSTTQKWQEFEAREEAGFTERAAFYLAKSRADRETGPIDDENELGEDMSRRSSMQSTQSSSFQHSAQSERHDSGVSVGTPEDASKSHGTPKNPIDEAVDLGNGQPFFGQMMANQRLGEWNSGLPATSGPVDLVDPAVYLGLSH